METVTHAPQADERARIRIQLVTYVLSGRLVSQLVMDVYAASTAGIQLETSAYAACNGKRAALVVTLLKLVNTIQLDYGHCLHDRHGQEPLRIVRPRDEAESQESLQLRRRDEPRWRARGGDTQ